MSTIPIQFPGSYAAGHAMAYADSTGSASLVSTQSPLPISVSQPVTTPLTGTTTATGLLGPFVPTIGRSVMLTLWDDWSGSVQVSRSTDGGATRLPLTIGGGIWTLFSTNCCEQVWDESESVAQLYLEVMITSGTLNYRLAQ